MSSYLPMGKLAAQVVAGLGVSKIVNDIVKNNVVIATTAQAVTVKVGAFVLGSMLWEQSAIHVEKQIDELVTYVEKIRNKNNIVETEE
jgi:hypothetical protein